MGRVRNLRQNLEIRSWIVGRFGQKAGLYQSFEAKAVSKFCALIENCVKACQKDSSLQEDIVVFMMRGWSIIAIQI